MSKENIPLWKRIAKKVIPPKGRETLKRIVVRAYIRLNRMGSKPEGLSGVNLIGHIRGDFGLGESCRIVAGALKAAEVPFCIYNIPLNGPAKEENIIWKDYEQSTLPYKVNLIHLNPSQLVGIVGKQILKGHYNIGYWLWELPEFPEEWDYAFSMVDEIWTPSDFVTQAIQKRTSKPVLSMPYGFAMPPIKETCTRAHFGLPEDRFLFLISYDGNSVSERKNPLGAIHAFCCAFRPEEKVGLVIKATHPRDEDLEQFEGLLADYHWNLLTDSFEKTKFNSLLCDVDVYVSLHRAEGFGLVMAEAMMLGTPVIATAWSANMEFMNSDVACMVDAKVVELAKDCPPYHKGNHWAEPDEAQAAGFMQKLYRDRTFYQYKSEAAREHLVKKLTLRNSGQNMQKRLEEIERKIGRE